MSKEEFKADDLGQIQRIKASDDDITLFYLITKIEEIRKAGHYIWAFPIKWRDENGKTYKTCFGWEIEYENGKCKTYGYSGEPEIPTYLDALRQAEQEYSSYISSNKKAQS